MKRVFKKIKFLRILKNKSFSSIWLTQVFSLTTAHMLNFILIDWIFKASDSAAAIALLYALYYLPTVIFGPFIGVLIDRMNKKRILILSNLSQAFIVLLYLSLGEKIWPIYTIILFYSLCDEFLNPAIAAALPAVVKRESLPLANGFFFLTTQTAVGLGYLMAGTILHFLPGSKIAFILASLILFSASLIATKLSKRVLQKSQKTRLSWFRFQKQLLEGYRFIKSEPRVFFPLLLIVGLQVLVRMGIVLLPSISQRILGIAFANSSFILVLPAFFGVAVGNSLIAKLSRTHRKKNLIGTGLFGVGFLIFLLGLFPFSRSLIFLSSLLAFGLGISFIIMFIPSLTLIQEHTHFNLRGRVFTTLNTLITLAAALPMLTAAALVDFFGIRTILVISALGIIGLGFYSQKGKHGLLVANHRS